LVEETPGVKEEELADLAKALQRAKATYHLDGICTGAMASVYQKSRVERICAGLGLECLSPLWGVNPEEHLRRLVDNGFAVVVVGVSAMGLTRDWLGRTLDYAAIDELVALGRKYRFHVGFEGGEGETFVIDAPCFAQRVEILSSEKRWKGDSGYLDITDAILVSKAGKAPGA
jgi:predicted ATP pyrophosphatase (TIGR00289 family)